MTLLKLIIVLLVGAPIIFALKKWVDRANNPEPHPLADQSK